jgi:hypothetical protein
VEVERLLLPVLRVISVDDITFAGLVSEAGSNLV